MNITGRIRGAIEHAEEKMRTLKRDEEDIGEVSDDTGRLLDAHSALCEYLIGELKDALKSLKKKNRNTRTRRNSVGANDPTAPN